MFKIIVMCTQYIFSKELKHYILRNTRSKVKFEDLENNCAEYIGIIGHWKGHFIGFEMSIK
jgi:hypothetical protein